ncbi:hypothetical protein UCD39_04335 [Nitrospirillum sp. BR 11752]|uniref:hypothetical protein n=1 Tax=Nitrospirillum sp. BR 11752 TaxID=3104293 RepID=UPI002ECB2DEB|nr:hypothetical protein [Nitrospirillum sp. BR 11752]
MTIQSTGRRPDGSPANGPVAAGDAHGDLTAADIRGRLVALSRSQALGRRAASQRGGHGDPAPGTPERD